MRRRRAALQVLSLAVRYFVVVVTVVASFLLYFLEPKDTHDPLRKAVTDSLVLLLIIVSGAIMTCQDEFYRCAAVAPLCQRPRRRHTTVAV